MLDLISQKIETLSNEAKTLIAKKEELQNTMNEIDVRLHQIAGAISELYTLLPISKPDHGDT